VGGFWLDNLFGDLSTVASGGSGSPSQQLAQPVNIGDTALYTLSSIGAVSAGSIIQISDGAASEVVTATAGSTGTSVFFAGTPARFAHATTAVAILRTGVTNYTHTFSVLNSGTGQPPTHTLSDTYGLTPSVLARCYPCASVAQIDLAGNPGTGLVTMKVAGASWLSQPAASTPTNPGFAAKAFPGWQTTVTVNSVIPYAGPWAVSMKRDMVIYQGANSLSPSWIARGGLTVTGTLGYPDPTNEGPLNQMLTGGLLPVQIVVSNGLSGSSLLSMTITASAAQAAKSKIDRSSGLVGYANAWTATDNSSDAGGSGGIGPVQVALTNNRPSY
jgi:hypothetical protein